MHVDQDIGGQGASEYGSTELKPGTTLLQGQYTIVQFLNSGGFGVTYLARDSLDRTVVIKECFPQTMCTRSRDLVRARSHAHQREFESVVRHFGMEARRLAKLKHDNIVGIHQVFEDKGTAYMALDFIEGYDLLDTIEEGHDRLRPPEVRQILIKVLHAVAYVHGHDILHRDISPDNILLDRNGNPVLIDFGAAKEEATRQSRVLSALHVVKDGYSPQEFYLAGGQQNASSDLYSLGATFFHVITGDPPPNSQERVAAIAAGRPDPYDALAGRIDGYDRDFLEAIDTALSVFPSDRIKSANEWIEIVDDERRRVAAYQRVKMDQEMEASIRQIVAETNRHVLSEIEKERVRKSERLRITTAERDAAAAAEAEKRRRLAQRTLEDLEQLEQMRREVEAETAAAIFESVEGEAEDDAPVVERPSLFSRLLRGAFQRQKSSGAARSEYL